MSFNAKNVIDLPDLDASVYRIFPISRLEQVIKGHQLVLVKPASWEDQFENVLLKSKARLNSGETVTLCGLRDKLYGQCWMLCPDSEAMWKLYSFPSSLPKRWFHRRVYGFNRWLNGLPAKQEGVKVRTTVKKLFTAFFDQTNKFSDLCYFIGRVAYHSQPDLEALLKDPAFVTSLVLDPTGQGHARSLLLKRDSFNHEQEVRLVFAANCPGYDPATPLYSFSIQPDSLFDEVILDPRLGQDERDDTTCRIRAWGYHGPISQSRLNVPPHFTIDLNA